jgi:lipid-A-disaccharide synthase
VSLPNIISGKEIIKELIQHKSDAKLIADEVYDLTFNQQRRDKMIEELKQMRELLEEKVSSKEVALALKEELSFGK